MKFRDIATIPRLKSGEGGNLGSLYFIHVNVKRSVSFFVLFVNDVPNLTQNTICSVMFQED